MKFEQTNPDYKSKKIEIKAKPRGAKEKIKSIARKVVLAGSIGAAGAGAIGVGVNEARDKYFTDYSSLPTVKEALKQAKKDNKIGFFYDEKYHDVEKEEKKQNKK